MENRNFKILKWSVIALAILNIVLLANMWMRPGHRKGPPPHLQNSGPKEMMIKELNFDESQVAKFNELIKVHRASMGDFEKKGREFHENYFNLLTSDSIDTKTKQDLEIAIAENQKGIEAITFEHFKQVKALCNGDQKKQFDNIIEDVMRHMQRPREPR